MVNLSAKAARAAGLGLGLALGLSHQAAAQSAGPDALSETYGDWTVRCAPDPGQPDAALSCEAIQELFQAESGQRLVAVTLRRDGVDGGGTITILAPFGLLLSDGLRLSDEGGGDLLVLGFRTCLPAGCFALAELDPATAGALGRAAGITLTMTAAGTGEPVIIPLLMNGLTDAWARLAR
ncbi:MAG: invasion associated locus B family protein [Rubellimicrobium sp.]|nr:invasion associated locus B family protein [Rubellimicrobium sp.]